MAVKNLTRLGVQMLALVLALALGLGGCEQAMKGEAGLIAPMPQAATGGEAGPAAASQSAVVRSGPLADEATAERLHEICHHLLIYYVRHQLLPISLEALAAESPGMPPPIDPVTGRGFLYYAPPQPFAGRPGDLLIHTAAARQGLYTVVLIGDAKTPGSVATQVLTMGVEEFARSSAAPLR